MEITDIGITAIKEIELFDVIILHHGFEEYNRDYYFIIESATKDNTGTFKILFTHCFDMNYRHKFADKEHPELLRRSLDDDLILPTVSEGREAYWWGQGFTSAYPGFSYDPDNLKAKEMTEITGIPMYAVNLETDHYEVNLIFHDFRYKHIDSNSDISDKAFIPKKDYKYNK